MKGQNAVTHKFGDGQSLLVNELYYTIQGEGPDAGRPAMFLRLAKCNLRCYFCDTEFESFTEYRIWDIVKEVVDLSKQRDCSLLVITGGEPLLQDICQLVNLCNVEGISVSIETAGTVFQPGLNSLFHPGRRLKNNLIVCSPKTPKLNDELVPLIGAFKYIIRVGEVSEKDGLPIASTQLMGDKADIYRPKTTAVPIYVQPMDEQDLIKNKANTELATTIAMKYGYHLSLQIHKLVGLP